MEHRPVLVVDRSTPGRARGASAVEPKPVLVEVRRAGGVSQYGQLPRTPDVATLKNDAGQVDVETAPLGPSLGLPLSGLGDNQGQSLFEPTQRLRTVARERTDVAPAATRIATLIFSGDDPA